MDHESTQPSLHTPEELDHLFDEPTGYAHSKAVGAMTLPPLLNHTSPNYTLHTMEAAHPDNNGNAYWDF